MSVAAPREPEALPERPISWWLPLLLGLASLVVLAARDLELSAAALVRNRLDLLEYLGRLGSPELRWIPLHLRAMGETLAIAIWGTALAFAIGLAVAPIAARNRSPGPVAFRLARMALNVMRSLPDLLLALAFVAALGLGPLPGVLALGLHTGGALGKFFAEYLERVDRGRYEAVEATGASPFQTLMYAGWPSVVPEVAAYTIAILDRNVRMACALGLVGAGGIGLPLSTSLRLFEYSRASAIILLIMATILAADLVASWLREKLR